MPSDCERSGGKIGSEELAASNSFRILAEKICPYLGECSRSTRQLREMLLGADIAIVSVVLALLDHTF